MKISHIHSRSRSAIIVVLLFTVLGVFTQCKKSIEDLINPDGTINFINPSFTTMSITFDGISYSIPPGGTASYKGKADRYATGNASTSGLTSSGSQIGLLMTWSLAYYFPAGGGTDDITLNVANDYFYLKIQNLSTKTITKVYSNYGLAGQTVDNLSIPNNGITYDLGYYRAYTNTNVRAESGTTFWYWNPVILPWSNNQTKTLIAN